MTGETYRDEPTSSCPRTARTDAADQAPSTAIDDILIDEAVALARRWITITGDGGGAAKQSSAESAGTERLAELVHDPHGVRFTVDFVDRVARPIDNRVGATELRRLVRGENSHVPAFIQGLDRSMIEAGAVFAPMLPSIVMPLARKRLRQLVGHLVVDAEPRALGRRIAKAKADGYRLNLNLLGEAVLGEKEARHRASQIRQLIRRSDVDYVSIKPSAVVSQLNAWDHDGSVRRLIARLMPLFFAARDSSPAVFINLDMEEYRDLDLTVAVFVDLMGRPELAQLEMGIVLQAYLPDVVAALETITAAAKARCENGGVPVKVRLVKGANLAMEHVEAVVHGWPQAPYETKEDVDANYVRILDLALQPQNASAVRLGIASHNLFDVALAHRIAVHRGVTSALDIEMLQGMAPAQAEAVRDAVGGLVLYTPVVHDDDFDVAVSYLVRRLEENAAEQNFLHALFAAPEQAEAKITEQEQRFRDSIARRNEVSAAPQRKQDRTAEEPPPSGETFANEPDTDPALVTNRSWARDRIAATPPQLTGRWLTADAQVDEVVDTAAKAGALWGVTPGAQRAQLLAAISNSLRAARGELMTAMVHETGKTVAESDPEISEAIDFASYYGHQAKVLNDVADARFEPNKVTVVTPPWNFPVAIPLGSLLAALAAGSAVIIKPAPQARLCAEVAVAAVQRAGVPEGLVQLVHAEESDVSRRLITHPDVETVVLTGSTETARLFRSWRPDLHLLAETSGKNAVIVTPSADLDLAALDVVRSAFGHAGQKCSAASLAICVGSVGTSKRFLGQLRDATTSLVVGFGSNIESAMGPLIESPSPALERALTRLDPGESWLVEPKRLDDDGRLWTPGIRVGVRPGAYAHLTEFFGPMLAVIAVPDLETAVEVQNATDFGLTGGIHSLDEDEIEYWMERVEVGNAYVNRHITGAIVRRQSFGGWKASVVGPGAKAGGPNYLGQFGRWVDEPTDEVSAPQSEQSPGVTNLLNAIAKIAAPEDLAWLKRAASSDEQAWREVFSVETDESGLDVEANVFRYRPLPSLDIRVGAGASARDVYRVMLAAACTGTKLKFSFDRKFETDSSHEPDTGVDTHSIISEWGLRDLAQIVGARIVIESEGAFASRVRGGGASDRIRLLGVSTRVWTSAGLDGVSVLASPPLLSGRRELLTMIREQAISRTLHRFGHVMSGPSSLGS